MIMIIISKRKDVGEAALKLINGCACCLNQLLGECQVTVSIRNKKIA